MLLVDRPELITLQNDQDVNYWYEFRSPPGQATWAEWFPSEPKSDVARGRDAHWSIQPNQIGRGQKLDEGQQLFPRNEGKAQDGTLQLP